MHEASSDCGSHFPARPDENVQTRATQGHSRSSRARRVALLAVLSLVTLFSLVVGRGNTPIAQAAPTENGYALVQDVTTANFSAMVDFALIPGRPDEAVVVTQTGMVWRVSLTGAFVRTEFGNLTGLIRGGTGGEEGLLSLAF